MTGPFVSFAKAVNAALVRNTALTTLIGAGRVFDDVPHAGEAAAKDYPYVVIGDQQGAEQGASDMDGADMTITIDAWSRGAGKQQMLGMLDCIYTALHDNGHSTETGQVIFLRYLGHETVPSGERETWHGLIRFRGLYQFGVAN